MKQPNGPAILEDWPYGRWLNSISFCKESYIWLCWCFSLDFSSISLCLCCMVSFCTWVWPLLTVSRWVQIHRGQSPWHFCSSFSMFSMCGLNSGDVTFLLSSSSSHMLWHGGLFINLLMFAGEGDITNVLRRSSQTKADRPPYPTTPCIV